MRSLFIKTLSRREAIQRCAWARYILKTKDGYICFEALKDYDNALNMQTLKNNERIIDTQNINED